MSKATRAIVLCFAALALAGLLNARGLRKTAEIQPAGAKRDAAIALTKRLVRLSSALDLDRLRSGIQEATGRTGVDAIDSEVRLAAPPPPPRLRRTPTAKRSATKPATPTRPAFTVAHPLRIWVAGDSLAEVPGEALERLAASRGALKVLGVESRLDTGLGRPDLYNWFTRIEAVIPELRPNVAVLSFGADDAHDYLSGVPAGRTIGRLGSPSWDAEYRRRVAGVTRELAAAGIYTVWLGLPITRGPGYRFGFETVNRIIRSVVRVYPTHSTYVDAWRLFATKKGRYADYLPNGHGQVVQVRAADGVHYQQVAGDMLARAVLGQLERVYALGG